MKVTAQLIDAMSNASAQARYEFFVKKVADWELAWGLFQDGWALLEGDAGERVFPLWPASEFAGHCASGDWAGYEPEQIALSDLLDELLPKLEHDGVKVGVFYLPAGKGVVIEPQNLRRDLQGEAQKYE